MKIRKQTLWRVPVFCALAGWVSFYLTVYLGGFFYVVTTVGADGIPVVSADPLRSAVFNAVLFLLILLAGGLWFFRSMTKGEIAVSAGLTAVFFLLTVCLQLLVTGLPGFLNAALVYIQNWTGMLSSLLFKLTGRMTFSIFAACFAPLLFVPFGRTQSE